MSTSKVISTARVPAGEGLYLRVGYNDHTGLDRLIAERKLRVEGLALDARWHDRQASLRQHADRASLATCLDTQAMELAMPGTASSGYRELPWANPAPHVPEDFSPQNIERCVDAIVERVADGQYSEVMAPAHYVAEAGSAWIDVDAQLTRVLRTKLDATDQADVKIIYPLAVHHKVFYDRNGRALLRRVLSRLPIDSVTLRIQPFGNGSGPQALRNFIEACWDFPLEKPLMIERAGFSGLAAFALGAVDLVESGITLGDSFDISRIQKPAARGGASFSPPKRLYVEALGTTVDHKVAAALMGSSRGKAYFACKDPTCCPNGYRDMLADHRRHSTLARQRQYVELARVPRTMRAEHFLQHMVSPVCDMLSRASATHPPFNGAHRRMLSVKETLLDLQQEQQRQREQHRPKTERDPSVRPGAKILDFPPRDSRGR